MLEVYDTGKTISSNSPLTFGSVVLDKGEAITLSGSNTIQLNRSGVYEVTLDVSAQPAIAGDFSIVMNKNGVSQPQSRITFPNATATAGISGSKTTLVQVPSNTLCKCCSTPTVLQFMNTGVGFNRGEYSLTVRRIC